MQFLFPETSLQDIHFFGVRMLASKRRHVSRQLLMALALCLTLLPTQILLAGDDEAAKNQETPEVKKTQELSPRGKAMWNRHWSIAAKSYIVFNNEYLCIRGYNERYPSSRSVTVTDLLRRDKGYTMRLRTRRGTTVDQRVTLSRAEAEAQAMALPEMAVGQYGFIHSVLVERILSPDAMIVRDVWLVDAQALHRARDDDRNRFSQDYDYSVASQLADEVYLNRLRLANTQQQAVFSREFVLQGFPTESLASGMRWSGPRDGGLQIALLTVRDVDDNMSPEKGRRRMLVAAPVGRLRNGLNSEQFMDLLKQRGMTPNELVDVIDEANRSIVRDIEKSMVDAIESKATPVEPPDDVQ